MKGESCFYFAYGSNMNAARMAQRGLDVQRALAGQLTSMQLLFNKRAYDEQPRAQGDVAYANIGYAPGRQVEGVLYQLSDVEEISKMDPFEGTPRFYSRELFAVQTLEGPIQAWVYVANRALLVDGLRPERWYLEHLLAGEAWLSEAYVERLQRVVCVGEAPEAS